MRVFTETVGTNGAQLTGYVQSDSEQLSNAAVRPAVLVLPGGGYQHCSDREAEPVALAYLAEGFNAFVLRYSVGPDATFDDALADARAALMTLQERAAELRADPVRVAAVGFSAGGHLAAALGTTGDLQPGALVLGYPVTLADMGPKMGTQIPEIGERVTAETPPTFVFSTRDDAVVPIENSLALAVALDRAGVDFELHVYASGVHGLSLAKPLTANGRADYVNEPVQAWLAQSVAFLRRLWGDFPVPVETADFR
ncbi:alpha/beta hydrolase [Georgenia halophila]|uniref:Alpha/beta hydrolase n=1 Tax=Georgenia halophila TaxID=620889 RepID=A0ABP8LIY3_9MICO